MTPTDRPSDFPFPYQTCRWAPKNNWVCTTPLSNKWHPLIWNDKACLRIGDAFHTNKKHSRKLHRLAHNYRIVISYQGQWTHSIAILQVTSSEGLFFIFFIFMWQYRIVWPSEQTWFLRSTVGGTSPFLVPTPFNIWWMCLIFSSIPQALPLNIDKAKIFALFTESGKFIIV